MECIQAPSSILFTGLKYALRPALLSAEKVIEEIQNLPRDEQSRVVQFAFELARSRQLSGAEIAVLAEKMVTMTDPSAKARLRAEFTRGFYGD